MHIFSELDGYKGEDFTTKILKYLLEHSVIFRYEFINYLNKELPSADLQIEKWFKCNLEEYTLTKENNVKGFIDLMITIDNAIIGIENKIGAKFTKNQPKKYLSKIKSLADDHQKIINVKVKQILIVFCPERRIEEIKEVIGKDKPSIHVLSWESLLNYISDKKRENNPIFSIMCKKDESIFGLDIVSEYLFENFKLFLYDYLNFLPNFADMYIDIRGNIVKKSKNDRRSFLRRLLKYLKLDYKLDDIYIGYGKDEYYSGFYLNYYTNKENEFMFNAWIGFIPNKRIDEQMKEGFELIIASNFSPIKENENLIYLAELDDKIRLNGKDAKHHWKIDYQKEWVNIDEWKNVLNDFIEHKKK